MAILKPNMSVKGLNYETTPKASLAEIVNQQGRQIAALTKQKHDLMVLLVALVKHPDAFSLDDHGRGWLEMQAIEELKENTTLRTERAPNDKVLIKVIESDYILRAEPFSLSTAFGPLGPGFPADKVQ